VRDARVAQKRVALVVAVVGGHEAIVSEELGVALLAVGDGDVLAAAQVPAAKKTRRRESRQVFVQVRVQDAGFGMQGFGSKGCVHLALRTGGQSMKKCAIKL